ncbi:antitoxin YezG family protein [Jatrophihabitans fulvus]
MAEPARSDPERARELVETIGRSLHGSIPSGAERIELVFSEVGFGSQSVAHAVVPDGRVPVLPELDVQDAAEELREAMYRPGAGTWFSATFTVTREGRMDADFDYDTEPRWDEGVPDEWFSKDLERFPRDDANRPDWLKAKVTPGD